MSASAAGADEDIDPLVWESFFWGLLSALSLNIGSIIGVTCLPSQRVRAVLMSFGGGALLFALSIELFGNVLHRSEVSNSTGQVWAMEGSAVVGGVFFALLNYVLNTAGADVRKPSTTKSRFARLRALLLRRLAGRLWKIPFFSVLSLDELRDLIQSAMYKERFGEGDIIMSSETRDSGIFFILSGLVRLQILDKDLPSPLPPSDLGETPLNKDVSEDVGNSWELGANQIFGDMTVLTGSHLQTVAVALEVTKVLVLPGHEVARLLETNRAVRNNVRLRAVERLRHVEGLKHLTDHALSTLSDRCSLVRYQPGEVVFKGAVTADTPVICLVLGSMELSFAGTGKKKTIQGRRLVCAEHLMGRPSQTFSASAVEPTSVLFINRSDIAAALEECPLSARSIESIHHTATVATAVGQREPSRHGSGSRENDAAGGPDGAAGLSSGGARPALPGQVLHSGTPPSPQQGADWGVAAAADAAAGGPGGPCRVNSKKGSPMSRKVSNGSDPFRKVSNGSDPFKTGKGELLGDGKLMLPCLPRHGAEADVVMDDSDATTPHEVNLGPRTLSMMQFPEDGIIKLGHDLGWDDPANQGDDGDNHTRDLPKLARFTSAAQMGQVTDKELAEQELEQKELSIRAPSKHSTRNSSKTSFRNCEQPEKGRTDVRPNAELPTVSEGKATHTHGGGGHHRAIMIWLGILIDAVPESLVIGILINRTAVAGDDASDRFSRATSAALPFVIGVFLSNLPESMSSSGSMKSHGMRVSTILSMWLATTVLTAGGASLGAVVFPPGSALDTSAELAVASVEGLAAGAMLTMIAQTMMPEAFEQGGDIVGLSCLAGFLAALSVKLFPSDY